jgi:hypothetical protein
MSKPSLKKAYESLIVKHDKFTGDITIALGLVRKYIEQNNLILVGGAAIDFALRLKGTHIYADDELPDYDFYSTEYHKDAYKIAEMLHRTGLKNISVINANHTSTMRVRVHYTVVADITYMPKKIFDILPTLRYRDLTIIHPHYQFIDQHRALSLPFENSPWEVILHRWQKDAKRHDLLYKYYPLAEVQSEEQKQQIKLTDEIKIPNIIFKNQCLGGFAALLYWHTEAQKMGFKSKLPSLGKLEIDSGGAVIQLPLDSHGVSIYTDDILKLKKHITAEQNIKKERQYRRFLDKLPHKFILDNKWELFDNDGHLLSAHQLDNMLWVSNLQNVLLYMLTNYILFQEMKGTARGKTFHVGYQLARELVQWAGDSYAQSKKQSATAKKLKTLMWFLPTNEVFGQSNLSDSYINSKRMFLEHLHERRPMHQAQIIFPHTFTNGKIPKKYYSFNPKKSPILQFDGGETNTYVDRVALDQH